MNILGKEWKTIWVEEDGRSIGVIDQTKLPHNLTPVTFNSCKEVVEAIKNMVVRGAPLIGVTGAYGLMLALKDDPSDASLMLAFKQLNSARPTAINLHWSLCRVVDKVKPLEYKLRAKAAKLEADLIAMEDERNCELIGDFGLDLFINLVEEKSIDLKARPLNLLTHCNAGWLATVNWGTALSPVYKAHRAGLNIHVWVDETRPRNQGASLTTFELGCEGVPHTLVVDNAGGYLMQSGQVDAVIVGSDRITRGGDVCNKIGTYLKALAAKDNGLPFYVAAPVSTIDWTIDDGLSDIPIEIRSQMEVTHINGLNSSAFAKQEETLIKLSPNFTKAFNPAFDITPSSLVTTLITERGVLRPDDVGSILTLSNV